MAAYPYTSTQNITPYPQQQYLYTHPKAPVPIAPNPSASKASPVNFAQPVGTKAPSPSPSPPEPCKNWDQAIKSFLQSVGLTQALRGLEHDMLVLNSDWEEQKVPGALQELANNIQKIQQRQYEERPLEDRKLDHIHLSNGSKPKTPTTLNKSISKFLAEKRANNEASNRAEFLRSLEKERAQAEASDASSSTEPSSSSCARTDAKAIDRNAQIKYDIAKNEDGPLRRTMRNRAPSGPLEMTATPSPSTSTAKGKAKAALLPKNDVSSDRHPGLDERLTNIESHLSVRYVPHAPQSLLDRLRFLEEHIIRIEKDYPPWAAIHFNQPNRNWPPPPKVTPIIVPPSMSRQIRPDPASQSVLSAGAISGTAKGKNSSLHRAVMERLEVNNAKLDLSEGR
ncbi:hypothetical protein BT96DRAFT_851083 [Gymnopus androsaceus JB14]|uniref:Uncharacterized protein n=1 Tax=Gymnopus androsaceus JB14 TaxID=1447944 RepID=A0A6A4I907_9AGAR|nr:hypothetical protein BT96DRAFT_851083 [Gymnopus androsaceus JB14]